MKWTAGLAAGLLLLTTARAGILPGFSLQDLNGSQFNTRDHVGKEVMVISFWATWCVPCKQLLTKLDKIKKEHPAIRIIAISTDDSSTMVGVRPYIAGKKFDFTVLLDIDGKVIQMFDPEKKVPFTLVVDKAGSIVYSRTGYLPGDEKEIQKIIEGLNR
ncbi:MAG: TlpA family protein disulfide reductase [Acidobacteriia bacterium]|nr:TlpA family protein disulfide reductase [Terriglobia bacterium]